MTEWGIFTLVISGLSFFCGLAVFINHRRRMERMDKIVCPNCHGIGELLIRVRTDAGKITEWGRYIRCPKCNGKGKL